MEESPPALSIIQLDSIVNRCLAHPQYLAIASTEGKLVLNRDGESITFHESCGENIQDMSICVSGDFIALCTGKKKIYVYDVYEASSQIYKVGSYANLVALSPQYDAQNVSFIYSDLKQVFLYMKGWVMSKENAIATEKEDIQQLT